MYCVKRNADKIQESLNGMAAAIRVNEEYKMSRDNAHLRT